MEGETSQETIEIASLRRSETPKPLSQEPSPPSSERRSLEDVIANPSTAAIHEFASSINQSATNEARKTEDFKQELRRRLFRVMVSTYAWSNARIAYETNMAERKLEKGVQDLLSAERDQDRARARLAELLAAVNRAVAAFAQA